MGRVRGSSKREERCVVQQKPMQHKFFLKSTIIHTSMNCASPLIQGFFFFNSKYHNAGEGNNPLHYCCLANPMNRRTW